MRATLERGKPHEQAVAIATLGERRDRSAAPLIAKQLVGDYPLVREWAKRALVKILGRCDVDLGGIGRGDRRARPSPAERLRGRPPLRPAGRRRRPTREEDPED